MDQSLIPSLSEGVVGSRFITQDEVETAKQRREEQWKAAYARLGQEPPPQQQEEVYDGRSLAEKLAANRIAKQEEWEEKTKLANQFRALEEDEIMFLDSIRERQEEEERQRKEKDGEEVRNFKEAVAARTSSVNQPPTISSLSGNASTSAATTAVKPKATLPKKDAKRGLKGVVVKKKAKPAVPTESAPEKSQPAKKQDSDDDLQPNAKRRKVTEDS
ncbi:PSME3-interacting protein [Psilocybe cubensis]|uniref:PSME3-interacting protein n=2 Tax=Psilocybe cubensis TaxID=181762 RepID=A0ACB8HGH8_PSICU|nr:PSME3-interacting protein [Psilocybe cubensis]KAH9486812.1 PSME3-interacting protein [Psilocybe cubensis]